MQNNQSISYITSKVVDAIDGIYQTRPSQEDKDLTFLILQFGGPSLLDICHKTNALPSVSTANRMSKELRDINTNIGTTPAQCFHTNTLLIKTIHPMHFP